MCAATEPLGYKRISRGPNNRPGSPMSCTACICSGESSRRIHRNLRPPVKSASSSSWSSSSKITASSRAAFSGSTISGICAYRLCVSRFVARTRPFLSTISARWPMIGEPDACAIGSSGTLPANMPMRAPTTTNAQKNASPMTKRRPSAR